MKAQAQRVVVTIAGAALGGLTGYLFFTEEGRRFRRRLEPNLDEINRELNRVRSTLRKAARAADEGWRIIEEITADRASDRSNGTPRQVAPF